MMSEASSSGRGDHWLQLLPVEENVGHNYYQLKKSLVTTVSVAKKLNSCWFNMLSCGGSDHYSGRVRFTEEEVSYHEAQILVQSTSKHNIEVRLGFLQIDHIYEIKFPFKDDLGDDILIEPKTKKNFSIKVLSYMPTEDGEGHEVTLEFNARKEHIVTENLLVTTKTKPKKKLTLHLCARILGKGKGTPILKEGIRIIHVPNDEESDINDSRFYSE